MVTAPWNGPDEVAHFAYASSCAQTGHAPQRYGGLGAAVDGGEHRAVQAQPLPHTPAAGREPYYSAFERTGRELGRLPSSAYKNGTGPNPGAHYPPLYYAYEAVFYKLTPSHSELTRLFVMRLATVLLFVVTVALTWLIATELLAVTWARTLATGLVALQPKLAFGAGIVNPDLMLVVLATGALLIGLRMVRRGPHVRSVLGLAVCSSAGVLTHPRGYFLIPFAVITLAVAAWRFRPAVRQALALGAGAVGIMVVGVAIALLWVRGHTHGGTGTGAGNPSVAGLDPRQFLSYVWQFYLPKLSFMDPKIGPSFYGYRQVYIESFFGNFASFSVNYRPVYYDALQLLAAVGPRGALHDGGRPVADGRRELARRRRVDHLLRRAHGIAAPRQLQLPSCQQRRRHHRALPSARGRALWLRRCVGVLLSAAPSGAPGGRDPPRVGGTPIRRRRGPEPGALLCVSSPRRSSS